MEKSRLVFCINLIGFCFGNISTHDDEFGVRGQLSNALHESLSIQIRHQ